MARREPGLARLTLAPGTMPVATGIIGDPQRAAVVAALDMAAERSGSTGLDRADDPAFVASQSADMLASIVRSVATENIGDLEWRGHRRGSVGRRQLRRQKVERTLCCADRASRHACVARRRRQIRVAEQNLDDADVHAIFQEMRREAVPQNMHADVFVEPGGLGCGSACGVKDGRFDWPVLVATGKQPDRWRHK